MTNFNDDKSLICEIDYKKVNSLNEVQLDDKAIVKIGNVTSVPDVVSIICEERFKKIFSEAPLLFFLIIQTNLEIRKLSKEIIKKLQNLWTSAKPLVIVVEYLDNKINTYFRKIGESKIKRIVEVENDFKFLLNAVINSLTH